MFGKKAEPTPFVLDQDSMLLCAGAFILQTFIVQVRAQRRRSDDSLVHNHPRARR